jgi:TetR/AcrR family transcriptional regulator, cholesterol catabolism regulator
MAASPDRRPTKHTATSPPPNPVRRRDSEVLSAATKVFYDRGYADATVQDVADALGILKGSLYHYIDTKEDLLFRLVEQIHDDGESILTEVNAAVDLGPLDRVELYVRRHIEFNLTHLTRVAVYHNDYERLSPERRARVVARRRQHERFLSGLIRAAQAAGEVHPGLDAPIVGSFIHGAVIWPYRWFKPNGRIDAGELIGASTEFVRHGIAGDLVRIRTQNQTIV